MTCPANGIGFEVFAAQVDKKGHSLRTRTLWTVRAPCEYFFCHSPLLWVFMALARMTTFAELLRTVPTSASFP